MWKKGLIFAVIILVVGASIVPINNVNIYEQYYTKGIGEKGLQESNACDTLNTCDNLFNLVEEKDDDFLIDNEMDNVKIKMIHNSDYLDKDSAKSGRLDGDDVEILSIDYHEDIFILENGEANLQLSIEVLSSKYAEMYREMLGASLDVEVEEVMVIPENMTTRKQDKIIIAAGRESFHTSVSKDHWYLLGLMTEVSYSEMVPIRENDECRVLLEANAFLQVNDYWDDVWNIGFGMNATHNMSSVTKYVASDIAFKKLMLESISGEQVFKRTWVTKIHLPENASLLNIDELMEMNWILDFGDGTYMVAHTSVENESTIILDEVLVVTESENINPTPIGKYKSFEIHYMLPDSPFLKDEGRNLDRGSRDLFVFDTGTITLFEEDFTYDLPGDFWDAEFYLHLSVDCRAYLSESQAWVLATAYAEAGITVTFQQDYTYDSGWIDIISPLSFHIWIGPVLIIIDVGPELRFEAGAEVGVTITASAWAEASLKMGASYSLWDGFSTIWEPSFDYGYTLPTLDEAYIKVWARPALSFPISAKVYGIIGPIVRPEIYLLGTMIWTLNTNYELDFFWNVKLGFCLSVGVIVGIPYIWEHSWEWEIADYTIMEWGNVNFDNLVLPPDLDDQPPDTWLVMYSPPMYHLGGNNWVTGKYLFFWFEAIDQGEVPTGVKYTMFKVYDNPWLEYNYPDVWCAHLIADPGYYYYDVKWYSVDNLSQQEDTNTYTVFAELNPPESTIDAPDTIHAYETPITLEAEDDLTGWRIWYRVWYDGTWSEWMNEEENTPVTVYFYGEGENRIEWCAEDSVWNFEDFQTEIFDVQPPSDQYYTFSTVGQSDLTEYDDGTTGDVWFYLPQNDLYYHIRGEFSSYDPNYQHGVAVKIYDRYANQWIMLGSQQVAPGDSSWHPFDYSVPNIYSYYLLIDTNEDAETEVRNGYLSYDSPPSACYEWGDADGSGSGTIIDFDATCSSDDDGIMLYEWDWTNDGSIEHVDYDPYCSHNYGETGLYECRLRVTDTMSQTADKIQYVYTGLNEYYEFSDSGTGILYIDCPTTLYILLSFDIKVNSNDPFTEFWIYYHNREEGHFEYLDPVTIESGKWETFSFIIPNHYTHRFYISTDNEYVEVVNGKIFYINSPPNMPFNPHPQNGETGVGQYRALTWSCTDPNPYDYLKYDLYFEANDPTPDILIAENLSVPSYFPNPYELETTYYWQIIAKDNLGKTTGGPIWYFTTTDTPGFTAMEFANAIVSTEYTDYIVDASFQYNDSTQAIILSSLGTMIPTDGGTFGLLSTGVAGATPVTTNQEDPGSENGTNFGGSTEKASITLLMEVPDDKHSINYDFQYFSTDYPERIGGAPGSKIDYFYVELFSPSKGTTTYRSDVNSGYFVLDSNDISGTGYDIFAVNEDPDSDYVTTTPGPGADAGATSIVPMGGLTHPVSPNEIITLKFSVIDGGNNLYDSSVFLDYLRFGSYDHGCPSAPSVSGPTEGDKDNFYIYTAVTTDPQGDQIYYQFDWGDGSNSDWLGPYNSGESCSESHSWISSGKYSVRARAKDENGRICGWGSVLNISIYANPTAELGGPYYNDYGKQIIIDGSASHDNDENGENIVRYDWKFFDTDSWHNDTGPVVSCTYNASGNYLISLRVYDDEGDFDIDTTSAFVFDSLPPIWKNQRQNMPNVLQGDSILLSAQGNDYMGLDRAWIATNETGNWINYTDLIIYEHFVDENNIAYKQNITVDTNAGEVKLKNTIGLIEDDTEDESYTPDASAWDCAPWTNTVDEDWNTYGERCGGGSAVAYINYYIPDDLIEAKVEWKNGLSTRNISIPLSCLSGEELQLRILSSHYGYGYNRGYERKSCIIDCYDEDGQYWIELDHVDSHNDDNAKRFYEEKVWWTNSSFYNGSGVLSSTNLLSYQNNVSSIDLFGYTSSSIPIGTSIDVQFSQDNNTWYNSSNIIDSWDLLSEGSNIINLSSLEWSGSNFYYKIKLETNIFNNQTPVLNDINIVYKQTEELTSYWTIDINSSSNTWVWSNFTWQNPFIPNGTVVGWRIYYSDTSGNKNCTNIMNFTIGESIQLPVIITNDSTDVEETSAILNGYLLDDGGEPCTVWFEYGTTIDYGNATTNETKLTGEAFSINISGLSPGSLYHSRAVVNNSIGTSYGFDKTFLTKPMPLTSFTATAINSIEINLSWTDGNGGDGAYIECWTEEDDTWEPGEHIKVGVNGYITMPYSHSGLTPETTYYYKAWAYAENQNIISDGSPTKPFGDNPQIANATTLSTIPKWQHQGQNKSSIQPGENISLYAQGKDDIALNWAWLATNETGEWINYTGVGGGSKYGSPMKMQENDQWQWSNFTWQNASIPVGTTVGWRIYYNDTSGNVNCTDIMSFTIGEEPNDPPMFSNENPPDGSIDVSVALSELTVTIEDPEGDSFDWSIETSPGIGSSSGTGEGNGTKICNISGLEYNTTYTWYVNATDTGSEETTAEVYNFTTEEEPNQPPYQPGDPDPYDGATNVSLNSTLSVYVSDPDGDSMDVYFYDNSTGQEIGSDTVSGNGRAYCSWVGLEENTTYCWYAVADDGEFTNQSDVWCFTTGFNHPPDKPDIDGPTEGIVDEELEFTVVTIDPDGDDVYYWINWDDGTSSGWIGPYASGEEANAPHKWTLPGDYEVRVKAKDMRDAVSEWSDLLVVTIVENEPPNAPDINGPTNGNAGTKYSYTFITTDPDEDDVYYFIDWGDGNFSGWIGPHESGEMISKSHTWDETGTYTIKAKAKDIYDEESSWGTLVVTMPLNLNQQSNPQSTPSPNQQNQGFGGEVKIINKEDPMDYEIIDVSLTTPHNNQQMSSQSWVNLFGGNILFNRLLSSLPGNFNL